jgi:hypothetical protein
LTQVERVAIDAHSWFVTAIAGEPSNYAPTIMDVTDPS